MQNLSKVPNAAANQVLPVSPHYVTIIANELFWGAISLLISTAFRMIFYGI